MRFDIGEKVTFMHESGYGIVRSYKDSHTVIVEDDTGFDREFSEGDLVKIHGDQTNIVQTDHGFDENYEVFERMGQTNIRGLTQHKDFWEIDLHSHKLLDTERGLSKTQILEKQLYEFKRCYREAKKKLIRKFVIIHGVGEGVLKTEVRRFLEGQDGIEFFDGSFREYGKGATEVRLYYKQ